MKNLGNLMKQAQQMQDKMEEMQKQLEAMEVEGVAGAGMVKVTLNGKGHARAVAIDPALATPDDIEVLQDLIIAAINDAKTKAEAESQARMAELTGGLSLPPGMKLPF